MSDSTDSVVPALLTRAGNFVGTYWKEFGAVFGIIGFGIQIVSTIFGVQLTPYGDLILSVVTDNSFIAILLVIVVISQVMLYQRVEWLVKQMEGEIEETDEMEEQELSPDGGNRNLPPRDSSGRFTSKDSGGSNLLLILLAAVAGYLFGNQYGGIEPLGAAFIAVAIVAFLQATER